MRLKELLKKIQDPIVVITHRNADFDGYTAALLIKKYLENCRKDVHIVTPEGVSRDVKNFMEKLGIKHYSTIESLEKLPVSTISTLVIVDVSSNSQLGEFQTLINDVSSIVWIDHHAVHAENVDISKLHLYACREASSTCEIVLSEIDDLFQILDRDLAILSIAAILVDSRRLSRARATTFEILAKLLKYVDISFELIVNNLYTREMPFDEKMARIKGMMRTEAYRFNNNIVCISHVSAHEASLARLLLEAGCDIAIIVSEHDTEFRVIARTRLDNVSMAEFCKKIGEILNGQGGGHDKAGAAAIPKREGLKIRKLMRLGVRVISEMIGCRLRKVRPY